MGGSSTSKILVMKTEDSCEATVRLVCLFRKLAKNGKEREYKLLSNGGKVQTNNWRIMRRLFGETRVCVGKRTRPLRKCKKILEQEGWVRIRDVKEASPMALELKRKLVQMFKFKKKKEKLRKLLISDLIRYYGAAKIFSTKRSRSRAKKIVTDVVREKFGMQISRRVVTKVRYDEWIKKGEVARLVKRKIGGLPRDNVVKEMVKQRTRVVWIRGPNVGEIIHNHRRYAASGVARCCCIDSFLPKEKGHVHFRLGTWEGCPEIAKNTKNVPKDWVDECGKRVGEEIMSSIHGIDWLNVDASFVKVTEIELSRCVDKSGSTEEGNMEQVINLKKKLDGFVCTPLDRNPGESLVMCAERYAAGMRSTLIANEGYERRKEEEKEILERMGKEYRKRKFGEYGVWKKGGRLGHAYALPKHKDTTKSRPICPTFSEPGNGLCKKVSQGLNGLLFNLPESRHFNLKSVHLMTDKLQRMNKKLERGCANVGVIAASYDIKDMFSRLPHETILKAVDWCIWWFETRGFQGIFVKVRGKGAKLSKGTKIDGYKFLSFTFVREYVEFDLGNCFTVASGIILRQTVGIPMGKSSSPPLTCLMCAKSERDFLLTLGSQKKLVAGIRFVDDASVFVAFNRRSEESRRRPEETVQAYEACYDANLTLKRTDAGEREWDFLGCRLKVGDEFPFLGCYQVMKNEKDLIGGGDLTFQTFQDFGSWTGKKAKVAAITSCLHRIRQNSTSTPGMIGTVILLRMELRRRSYPDGLFRQAIRIFAKDKERVWKMIAELLCPRDV
ncbi:hypothetical protein CBR_g32318 [Chara braunii]|uniref:Reverse transcriptase domain-containing protein n=1 Tax=Chara braunii TaxID=69332 RepID=A0A388JNF7_CHABU|nr:hypothetical protein CBR_g32318 [Chara braunii]|eukprot:GBG59305.1 hypothetical protein CBR_g32318 [Chara braunii]